MFEGPVPPVADDALEVSKTWCMSVALVAGSVCGSIATATTWSMAWWRSLFRSITGRPVYLRC
jgi:hypothetical protein